MHASAVEKGESTFDDADKIKVLEVAQQMANEALRVLAIAWRPNATAENASAV